MSQTNELPIPSKREVWHDEPVKFPRAPIFIGLLVALLYLAIGLLFLGNGSPHEDAYILFKYAKELGSGNGIVYFAGGPRAEGGTDFLWMVILAILYSCGIDPALGALVVNATSAGIAAFLFSLLLRHSSARIPVLALTPLLLLFLPSANAGYVGFSVQFYSTATLLLYAAYVSTSTKKQEAVPLLALLLGLIRPDGVIIGGGFVGLGLWNAYNDKRLGRYLVTLAIALVLGGAYFVLRYNYFRLALPLPLYVKGHGASLLPTLAFTVRWLFVQNARYLILITSLLLFSRPSRETIRLLLGLLPLGLHLAALSFSDQSQNVAFRFEAPVIIVAFYLCVALLAQHADRFTSLFQQAVMGFLLLFATLPDLSNMLELWSSATSAEYVDDFSFKLGAVLPAERTFALSEAGRLGYWNKAKLYDLVGLNNPDTALHPPTSDYLNTIAPDLIMFHHAKTLEVHKLESTQPGGKLTILPATETLRHLLLPEYESIYSDCTRDLYHSKSPGNVKVAAICTAHYLDQNRAAYEIILVRYQGALDHVYALRRNLPEFAQISKILDESFLAKPASYLQHIR